MTSPERSPCTAFDAEVNRRVYEDPRETLIYRDRVELHPAERLMLERLRDRWREIEVLDVGVGAGRTAYTFAAIAGHYVGLDYSREMIRLSRQLVGECDHVEFVLGDVRDLSAFEDGRFGFVLFSHNGIDAIPPEDRQLALRELRRVLAGEGHLLLSSHSLDGLPLRAPSKPPALRRPLKPLARSVYAFFQQAANAVRFRVANRSLDLDEARRRGWTVARDAGHSFALDHYYVRAATQVAQCRDAGLEVAEILDPDGNPVAADNPGRHGWLNYVCRPLEGSGS
jgi:ubiquinone/menaquinone biosynthesis C-methylase UbiE